MEVSDIFIQGLQNPCLERNLKLYSFETKQHEIVEVSKETQGRKHTVGIYIEKANPKEINLYERLTQNDPISEQLLRVHGPNHPHGRGPDPYLWRVENFEKNNIKQKEFFRDIKNFPNDPLKVIKQIVKEVDKLLIPTHKKIGKTRDLEIN
jgi:hypothetical protein